MKKLIAVAVVLALVVGTAFAVDLGGTVFGLVNVVQGTSEEGNDDITASGSFERARIDGSGEVADGAFGGYIRLDKGGFADAYAWWKPIDQFKLIIGNNGDGFWDINGVVGWGFNQMAYDGGVATNPGIWYGWGGWAPGQASVYDGPSPMYTRYTFTEGVTEDAALLEIKPLDMVGINIGIPFFRGGKLEDIFKAIYAQVNLNFDFGHIAFSYDGGGRSVTQYGDAGAIFLYFGGSFGDLGLDVGFAYHLKDEDADDNPPIGVGLGLKYATDAFGVKFRLTAALGGDDKNTFINTSILPYFALNDNISVFINAGLGLISYDPDLELDPTVGFYINPYLRVGAEWGPTFYAGLKIEASGAKDAKDNAIITWSVPIAIMVSF